MKKINDGGTAFPSITGPGMTLRDWFAGQAMQGFLTNELPSGIASELTGESRLSKAAYLVADAMIAARDASDD